MVIFMNPFQNHDVNDFPDVYVPLALAERHPSIIAAHEEKPGLQDKGQGGAGNEYSAHTVEGLRAEIDLGMAGGVKACKNDW